MEHPLIWLLHSLLSIYSLFLIIYIILQWLIHFQIVNPYQPFVAQVLQGLSRLIEPVLRRIRRYLPAMGALDLSPILLFVAIKFAQYNLLYYF